VRWHEWPVGPVGDVRQEVVKMCASDLANISLSSLQWLGQASRVVDVRGTVKDAMICDAIRDVSRSSSLCSEMGSACGERRQFLVGMDKGTWIARECE